MRRLRSQRGSSLLEMVLSLGFALAVVAGAGAVAKSSGDLAATSGMIDGASRRVQRVLDAATDEIRRVSLGSIRRPDGAALADGDSAEGVQYRRVLGYVGSLQLDDPMALRWDRDAGAAEGEVVLVDGPIVQTVARNVTDFAITRNGDAFTVRVEVRMGSSSDRGRTSRGTVTIRTRNP